MLLVIDVGNTQTVIGIYDGCQDFKKAIASSDSSPEVLWRISTSKSDTADDIRSKVESLIMAYLPEDRSISGAVIASVVPSLTRSWTQAVKAIFGIDPVKCDARTATELGLFDTSYPNPREIGDDRVADSVALRLLYGGPAIVVDFGTATNLEAIDANGRFVGGIIAPGMETSANALYMKASRLSSPELYVPSSSIGQTTDDAVRLGVVLGEAVRADGLIACMKEQLRADGLDGGRECTVVATGGLAPLVSAHSSQVMDIRPDITLVGLRIVGEALKEEKADA